MQLKLFEQETKKIETYRAEQKEHKRWLRAKERAKLKRTNGEQEASETWTQQH